MPKTQPVKATSTDLTIADLQDLAQAWIDDGEIRQFSARTLDERKRITGKLLWFLKDRELSTCGTRELRSFLAYISRGHNEAGGRWGNERCTGAVKPSTVKAYHRVLHAFFNWLTESEEIEASPLDALKAPLVRQDQIQPFTQDQVAALLEAARKSSGGRRNEALLLFMLDTGCRASEVCSLTLGELDLTGRKVRIRGKGNKERTVYLGRQATRVMFAYLREEDPDPSCPLWVARRGPRMGEAFSRHALWELLSELGKAANIQGVRCSPHTFRHTFAVEFLRAGGNVFTLKELLGHTTLAMTNKYVALAQADLEAQHRQFSPGDRIKRK